MINKINIFKTLFLFLFLFTGCLSLQTTFAQSQDRDNEEAGNTRYDVSTSVYGSTSGNLPFWFYTNVHGKVDPSGTNWLNQLSLEHKLYDNNNLSARIGGNAVFRFSNNSQVLFPKLYLQANAYGLQLDVGRFSQPIGLNNHELSVGSMMVSNNAMPMPKISISTSEFMDVPYTDGHLQYKGLFSHGWFEEDRFVSNAYLHQKYFYLRVNVGNWSGTGGIVHNVQWGGTHPNLAKLPQSFGDYLRVVTGRSASKSSNAPGSDLTNVIGNSLAAYEFGLRYSNDQVSIHATRLFYLEDKVSTRFRSPWDGVWGLNIKFKEKPNWLNAITYEHINTKQQDSKSWELIGSADYYDNGTYSHGWTYENSTVGIPLILFKNNDITNNVLVAHHLGIAGDPDDRLSYNALFTYSRNYGIQDDWVESPGNNIPKDRPDVTPYGQFLQDQYSWLLRLEYDIQRVNGLSMKLEISGDFGELYEDRLGIMVGVSWTNVF